MKIGNIEFGNRPVFLAPMEDVTDIGFRMLCKRFGASMVYTEFVSAEALVRSVKSTVSKLTICDEERPVGIQIYGRDVPQMVEAAKIVEQEAHPDVIDLNFGCPVKKVAGKGAGAGMLKNVPLLLDITRNVVRAVNTPVTVKTRLGWDCEHLIIPQLAEQLQDCGIAALTIHGRTRSQMYTGSADWTLIGEVKRNPRITIPIIGNGDIVSPQDALDAFERYGVDAIMVGRATFGRPWIFKEIRDFLGFSEVRGERLEVGDMPSLEVSGERSEVRDMPSLEVSGERLEVRDMPFLEVRGKGIEVRDMPTGEDLEMNIIRNRYGNDIGKNTLCSNSLTSHPLPLTSKNPLPLTSKELTLNDKIDILEEQLRINVERIDEYRGILHTRRHLAATPIFKGIPDFRQTRIAMLRAATVDELTAILEECRRRLTSEGSGS